MSYLVNDWSHDRRYTSIMSSLPFEDDLSMSCAVVGTRKMLRSGATPAGPHMCSAEDALGFSGWSENARGSVSHDGRLDYCRLDIHEKALPSCYDSSYSQDF